MTKPKFTKQEIEKRLEIALSIGDAPIGDKFLANVDKQTINDALFYLKETATSVASVDIPNESEILRVIGNMAEHISRAEYVDSTYVDCVDVSVFKDGIELIKQLLAYQHFLVTHNKHQEAEIERLRDFLETADECIDECEYSLTKVSNSRVESAVNDWANSGYAEYLKELED